jgi:glycerate-2-kinase
VDRSEERALTHPDHRLRQHLLDIISAGSAAGDGTRLVTAALAERDVIARLGRGPIRVVAAGKAAIPMARAAAERLGPALASGVLAAPSLPIEIPAFDSIAAGHPVPTEASVRAGHRALTLAASCTADERLLVLLSGGASALLAVPAPGLSLDDKMQTTRALLAAGAEIHALNAVRKHLSSVKGGRLAAVSAAPVLTLAISDVVAPVPDDPSVIGSGPTVPDPTTFRDALAAVHHLGVSSAIPAAVAALLERGARGDVPDTPKPGDPRLSRSLFRLIGSRHDVLRGCQAAAHALGYSTILIDEPVVGEAAVAARGYLTRVLDRVSGLPRPVCLLSAGETTVRVKGAGRGGRNQEFALALVEPLGGLAADCAVASVGTDGVDGPTDAAGAIVDPTTRARATDAGLDPAAFLTANDSHSFFDALGDLVRTGATGTNVGDLQVALFR